MLTVELSAKKTTTSTRNILGQLFSAWSYLNEDEKREVILKLRFKPPNPPKPFDEPVTSASGRETSPEGIIWTVDLDLTYQYFYYYPYMNWSLDRTPETNYYWVGLFKVGAKDDEYIAYKYIGKTTSGSYYVGKVEGSLPGNGVQEDYELRMFDGATKKEGTITNIMTGRAFSTATFDTTVQQHDLLEERRRHDPFSKAIAELAECDVAPFAGENWLQAADTVVACWGGLSFELQQLVFPRLEQETLPSCQINAEEHLEGPEPKDLFPNLGKNLDGPELATEAGPSLITLSISLYDSYTYVYPRVYVKQATGGHYGWIGLYPTQHNVSFNPDNPLAYTWCGDGYTGQHINLSSQKAQAYGSVNSEYLGVIFTWDANAGRYTQMGITPHAITAGVTVSPAAPPARHEIKFDVPLAIRLAELSQLAYQSYSHIKERLPQFNLAPVMEISNQGTDTNGFIASNDSEVVVVFRGTELTSWKDWLTDLYFNQAQISSGPKTVYAHYGFIFALDSVYQSILAKLKSILSNFDNRRLVITGHSLGGALASLLAFRLAAEFPTRARVLYSFGCPPVGDRDFVEAFEVSNSATIMMPGDVFGDLLVNNVLPKLGPWVNLYLPQTVYYLPKNRGLIGHQIAEYIAELKSLPTAGPDTYGEKDEELKWQLCRRMEQIHGDLDLLRKGVEAAL